MPAKQILSIVGIIDGFIGYAPYIRNTFRGTTKPHVFSWLLWGVLETIAFIAQVKKGAGAGAWIIGFSALVALFIAFKAWRIGEKDITRLDWFGFIGALVGVVVWIFTKDPTGTVIIVTITDALAFIPTYRKGFQKPDEETIIEYALSSVKMALSVLALQTYNIATYLYPASLVVTNGIFTVMVMARRRKLAASKIS